MRLSESDSRVMGWAGDVVLVKVELVSNEMGGP